MFDSSSVFQHFKLPCRSLSSQLGESERHCFFVGTYSIKNENELHLIEFIEETNDIVELNSFKHPNEMNQIDSCPKMSSLLFTCHRGGYMKKHFKPMLKSCNSQNDEKANNENEIVDDDDEDKNDWWQDRINDDLYNYNATLWKLVDLDSTNDDDTVENEICIKMEGDNDDLNDGLDKDGTLSVTQSSDFDVCFVSQEKKEKNVHPCTNIFLFEPFFVVFVVFVYN